MPTGSLNYDAMYPAIARLGSRLAYSSFKIDDNIWRANSKQPLQSVISSSGRDLNAQYSPDGDKIAFASDRSGHLEIWVSSSQGNDPQQLTHFDGPHTGSPAWSPNG